MFNENVNVTEVEGARVNNNNNIKVNLDNHTISINDSVTGFVHFKNGYTLRLALLKTIEPRDWDAYKHHTFHEIHYSGHYDFTGNNYQDIREELDIEHIWEDDNPKPFEDIRARGYRQNMIEGESKYPVLVHHHESTIVLLTGEEIEITESAEEAWEIIRVGVGQGVWVGAAQKPSPKKSKE